MLRSLKVGFTKVSNHSWTQLKKGEEYSPDRMEWNLQRLATSKYTFFVWEWSTWEGRYLSTPAGTCKSYWWANVNDVVNSRVCQQLAMILELYFYFWYKLQTDTELCTTKLQQPLPHTCKQGPCMLSLSHWWMGPLAEWVIGQLVIGWMGFIEWMHGIDE